MIIYSLNDAAKYLECSLKTVQRMVEKGEMPAPIREEKDKGGRIWRLWDSAHFEEIKKKVQERQKHSPCGRKVSKNVDTEKKITSPKDSKKSNV